MFLTESPCPFHWLGSNNISAASASTFSSSPWFVEQGEMLDNGVDEGHQRRVLFWESGLCALQEVQSPYARSDPLDSEEASEER